MRRREWAETTYGWRIQSLESSCKALAIVAAERIDAQRNPAEMDRLRKRIRDASQWLAFEDVPSWVRDCVKAAGGGDFPRRGAKR